MEMSYTIAPFSRYQFFSTLPGIALLPENRWSMASVIELLNRLDAAGLLGISAKGQRVLKITGDRCDEIEQSMLAQGYGFGAIFIRDGAEIVMICLMVPEYGVQQADGDVFNKAFMRFKLAEKILFDSWLIPAGFKAAPVGYY